MAEMLPGQNTLWTVDPLFNLPITMDAEGPGSYEPATVIGRFRERVAESGNDNAIHQQQAGGEWKSWTWNDYHADVMKAAKSFISLGLPQGSGCCVLGFNSPEWFIADVGAIAAGLIAAGIYTTNGPESCQYVIDHCKAGIVFVENQKQLAKIQEVRGDLPLLQTVVMWGEEPTTDDVISFAAFLELGAEVTDEVLEARIAEAQPGQCASLIYTSGTTGTPKAVMISHDNVTWTSRVIGQQLGLGTSDVTVSYLPLSHIAAQMLDIHCPISIGAQIYFALPSALKGTLGQTLKAVRPTYFLGVPRVWEKIQEKMQAMGAQSSGLKKAIGSWAKGKGLEGNYNQQRGAAVPWGWWLASKLVFGKVRAALGLDRCRFMATAAAPIAKETLEYFLSLDLPILEIYGMSESTGPQTVSLPHAYRTGSTGRAFPGAKMRITDDNNVVLGQDEDGEICYNGRHRFTGYMYNPEATAKTIDAEGYLLSGDIGQVDAEGFLRITGRKKELLITAGGENVAPVPIESALKAEMHLVSNAVVIGDRRKFLSVLLTARVEMDLETGLPTEQLTGQALGELAKIGSTATTLSELLAEAADEGSAVATYINEGIARANDIAVSRASTVKAWRLLDTDFSVGGGSLTATMKLKRRIVYQQQEDVIEAIYQ